jgi:DNA-binding NarL/FixJ family response regulator
MYELLFSKYRVLIVGMDELIREGLFFLVSRLMPNATVFVVSGDEELDAELVQIDLILYLLRPPYLAGLDEMYALRNRHGDAALLALSDSKEDYLVGIAAANHINGFMLVSDQVESLQTAIIDVLSGKSVFPEGRKFRGRRLPPPKLTPRQMQVYEYLCSGKTNKEIGAMLKLSDNTVRTHVSAILEVLGVNNRTEATKLDKLFRRD